MLHQTTAEAFATQAKTQRFAVVSRELYGDLITPTQAFRALNRPNSQAVLLDSSEYQHDEEACIYIGLNPLAQFQSTGTTVTITDAKQCETKTAEHPFAALREFYQTYQCQPPASKQSTIESRFIGGMVGFISYDVVHQLENIPDQHENHNKLPDINFCFYQTYLIFDKRSRKMSVSYITPDADYQFAMQQLDNTINQLTQPATGFQKTIKKTTTTTVNIDVNIDISDTEYQEKIRQAQALIHQGEVFQIVLSRCFTTDYHGDHFDVYRALLALNPASYQFYLQAPDYTLVGSSPERLVSVRNGSIETMPIAGTRPRGKTPEEDETLAAELLQDDKEIAEHMMLIDLARNDVGRVAKAGSITVPEFQQVQKYSRVMHMVSKVRGEIATSYDVFDTLPALFPAGTLSGAPKIRAMQLIDQLETSRRGHYGGAICSIDNQGNLDSCITIRSALIKQNKALVRAGGGIVLDSNPQTEADESRHKAKTVLDALTLARGGLL